MHQGHVGLPLPQQLPLLLGVTQKQVDGDGARFTGVSVEQFSSSSPEAPALVAKARLGWSAAAARSLQQRDPELPLELGDRSGQRWLSDAQAVGSTAEVQLLCYGDEVPQLAGQTIALVTGANKGIGYAIAAGLGALSWSVGVGARDDQRREEAVAKLIAAGVAAVGVALDVTDDASVAEAATD